MAIQLKIDRVLQGSFDLKALNLLFVFQVNCPGCFIYGFPRQQAALEVSSVGLNVLGLSTAFEDFEYNTAANTELLLTEMKLVGATRQALGELLSSDRLSRCSRSTPQVQHSQHLKTLSFN